MGAPPAAAGSDPMRPYLTYSFGLHLAAVAAAALFLKSGSIRATPVYTIDFVGPTAGIIGRSVETGAAAQAADAPRGPERRAREEELVAPSKKRLALPKPSLFSKALPPPALGAETEEEPSEPSPAEQGTSAGEGTGEALSGTPGSGGVVTDLPNFPYPWYISQVRSRLWSQWSSRMPGEQGLTVVVFTIMPDGSLVDIRTEESSGDAGFDLAAMAAARDAGPFPPLPSGFAEPFLKVHVTLKSGR
ncbi:MAG: TonB C-terminal domain-containing protein [Elusimicrobia bacterium]|nr:TonB C-terminal domain-containing protein [Elusimicrobiota bacterium]